MSKENRDSIIDLNSFAEGALLQKVNKEAAKVMQNIHDPNTDFKTKRTLTITIDFSPNAKRQEADVDFRVTSKLAPEVGGSSKMVLGMVDGKVVGKELKSGIIDQLYFDGESVKTDVGEDVEEAEKEEAKKNNSVVSFRGAK